MVTPIQIVQAAAPQSRKLRRPQHSFNLRQKPFAIQPFMIAPVLPGETMENLLLQARVVSDPIKNPLIGWWTEFYVFYVKHRDLNERDKITAMHLNAAEDVSSLRVDAGGSVVNYTFPLGMAWTRMCLQRVTETYFRNEGETWNGNLIASMPAASVQQDSWLDSVKNEDDVPAGHAPDDLPGEGDASYTPVPGFETQYAQWQHMRALKVTDATFEDYLKSFGVNVPAAQQVEDHKPELLRYVRDWTYPSNTVEPSTGVPSSACSWAISERADKARFFSEPGFIFGVWVTRPKVYISKQKGSVSGLLDNAYGWLPAVMDAEPYTSLKRSLAAAGPLAGNITDDYWVDLRDLFMYGEQFVNFALTATDAGLVGLPTTAMQKRYPLEADVNALFAGTTPPALIKCDGRVDMSIRSRLRDLT